MVNPRGDPLVSPGVTSMVSLWLTLSLCKFNFHEIDAPTHHGSFPPVVNPRGDPRGDPLVSPRVTSMVSLWLRLMPLPTTGAFPLW